MRIAIDSGGTFTDCVFLLDGEVRVLKVFSTPDDPGRAVLECVRRVLGGGVGADLRHGTTVGTNAMLERKGARVALVTTSGFEDAIAIGRQARASLYDWFASPPPCVVLPAMRFGVAERTASSGEVLVSPAEEELAALARRVGASGAEAVAVSLLFSFANAENERRVAEALAGLGLPVSLSHEILPEFREFERASTVVTNAYLAPLVGSYLGRLEEALGRESPGSSLTVMQSSGGIVGARLAAREPVRTVLSGPAGGVMGALRVGRAAGFERMIGFDMGGTSTDVCLMDAGGARMTSEAVVSGMPVGAPMLDIHTVGAGGGSLAWFDAGGILRVGPESAGAVPGPVCYGRGMRPTVTDANLVLGRLDPDGFLGGGVRLDVARTREAMEAARGGLRTVEEFAGGVVLLAEAAMEKAVRLISVERGYDLREFTLLSFGGAGPLHACAMARSLRIPRVLVPRMPGALSALGILLADTVRDYSRTVMVAAVERADALEEVFAALEERGLRELAEDGMVGVAVRSVDLRYAGQGYELNVPASAGMLEAFHALHERRYGYAARAARVEAVTVRVRFTVAAEALEMPFAKEVDGDGGQAVVGRRPMYFAGEWVDGLVYGRERLRAGDRFWGPALVTEYSATTVAPPGCVVRVDGFGNLVVEVVGGGGGPALPDAGQAPSAEPIQG